MVEVLHNLDQILCTLIWVKNMHTQVGVNQWVANARAGMNQWAEYYVRFVVNPWVA